MLLPHLTAEIHCDAFPEAEPARILLVSSLCAGLAARPVINVDAQVRALLDLPDILSQTSAV